MPVEPDSVWVGSMPDAYDRGLGEAVFRPFAREVATRAAAHRPSRVLELAAGTGILTRELVAALPGAHVTATDLNAAMVAHGAAAVPGAVWEQADAQRPPYRDGSFDLVACQFGVMFLPDRPAAFAQVRRMLVPGGRLLATSWDALEHHGFEVPLMRVLEAMFPDDPPTFLARIPHGYADVETIAADVRAGGLDPVVVETVELVGHADSAAQVALGYCTGTPVRAEIAARGDVATVAAAVAAELTALLGEGPVEGRMRAHVVEAVRSR